MFEQISIFDLLNPVESRFTSQMKRGSGFEGGKVRIYAASLHTNKDQFAAFLKEEYGIGGFSADFPDGGRGFTDYNAKGITIREWKSKQEEKHNWKEVAAEIKRLIISGEYLTDKDKAKVQEVADNNGGSLPMPHPRMSWPYEIERRRSA